VVDEGYAYGLKRAKGNRLTGRKPETMSRKELKDLEVRGHPKNPYDKEEKILLWLAWNKGFIKAMRENIA
jgi:hypothetical protein